MYTSITHVCPKIFPAADFDGFFCLNVVVTEKANTFEHQTKTERKKNIPAFCTVFCQSGVERFHTWQATKSWAHHFKLYVL